MKIAMSGAGYVGLVSGGCFSDFGHDVICFDTHPDKIAMLKHGEVETFEPGRLCFTTDLNLGLDGGGHCRGRPDHTSADSLNQSGL